jgi:hypothetical protein
VNNWVRSILAGIGAIVVAGFIISHLSGGSSTTTQGNTAGSPSRAGGIGTSFDLQDGDGDTYQVTLVKIIDPAQSSDQYLTPDSGSRFAAAVFTVKAVSGSPQDEDAND